MPEDREKKAAALLASIFFNEKRNTTCWKVKNLWADATDNEQSLAYGTSRHKDGLVDRISSKWPRRRGGSNHEDYIWPETWRETPQNKRPSSIQLLRLDDITHSSRCMILHLRNLFLRVSLRNLLKIVHSLTETGTGSISYAHNNPVLYQISVGGINHECE